MLCSVWTGNMLLASSETRKFFSVFSQSCKIERHRAPLLLFTSYSSFLAAMTCVPLLVCGLTQDRTACDGRLRQARFGESLAEGGGRISAKTRGESAGVWPLCVEIVHWAFGRSCHTLPALVLALLECIPPKIPVSMQTSLIVAEYYMDSISHSGPGNS